MASRFTATPIRTTPGSTFLSQLLPPWVHEGGIDALIGRLQSDAVRSRLAHELETGLPGWPNILAAAGSWDRVLIASVSRPELAAAEGRSVADLAAAAGKDPLAWTLDLLIADRGSPVMIVTMMDWADVDTALTFAATGIGSDQLGVTSDTARVHPRCYGTFARVLGRYVRERGLLSLETAIHKMTGLPAEVLGLTDRGRGGAGGRRRPRALRPGDDRRRRDLRGPDATLARRRMGVPGGPGGNGARRDRGPRPGPGSLPASSIPTSGAERSRRERARLRDADPAGGPSVGAVPHGGGTDRKSAAIYAADI